MFGSIAEDGSLDRELYTFLDHVQNLHIHAVRAKILMSFFSRFSVDRLILWIWV